MNEAHFHMVVNHFPIIGTILGLGIILIGFSIKNKSVINTAYGLFIIAALFAAASMATGEGAEEMVEDMPNIGKKIIHEHEEIAEKFALVLYVLVSVSIVGIYFNLTNNNKSKITTYAAIFISIVGVYFVQKTGTTGGEIRHTEIRSTPSNTSAIETNNEDDEN